MRALVPVLAALAVVVVAILLLGGPPSGDGLTAITWQWTATTTREAAAPSTVPDSSGYTIEFRPDRTFRANADCYAVSGRYRRIPPGRMGPLTGLTITPGPNSLVACGAGSLSEAYVKDLERATSYRIADGQLTITLADGGTMTFR